MLDWRRTPGTTSLIDMLHQGADAHPDRNFTVHRGDRLTWAEARSAVGGLAAELAADTDVALYIPNSPTFLIAFLAALQARARPALINAGLPVPLTQAIIDEIAPAAVLTGGQTELDRGERALTSLPAGIECVAPVIEPEATAAYFFTGGTTGVPKRIAYSHELMVTAT